MSEDFVHRFEPGQSGYTLLLLHGTGGDENDLLPVGHGLAPGAALLSPRGKVLEHGMPRFFRRIAEGVFDLKDLRIRAAELAGFVTASATRYGFDPARVYAAGYSNGANIAAAVLLLHPGVLAGGVLFRPMVPLEPEPLPSLTNVPVLILAGQNDPIVTPANSEHLAKLLSKAGADVEVRWQAAGHALAMEDFQAGREWTKKVLV